MGWKYATETEARTAWETQRNAHAKATRDAMRELRRRHLAEYDELLAAAKRGDL